MGIRIIGDRRDAIAFGLAGVDAVECRTRADLIAALDEAQRDPEVAVVVVSPVAAALGADVIARLRESSRLPITIVLPDHHGVEPERAHAA
jgi:vacuolar-type H+-ATPase subunit F/Vma7